MSGDPVDIVLGDGEAMRRFLEQTPTAMATVEGPGLTFVMANAAYRALVGRQDLIGHSVRDVFPEAEGQGLFEMLDRVRLTGEPATITAMRAQIVVDDSGQPVEIFLDTLELPARDEDGTVVGVHFQTVDVTERVRAERRSEERARVAERRYAGAQAVVRTLQDALLPVDLPVLPRLDIAARYLLAGQDEAAGGDWFDAVVRPDGRVALVVGDVVGHGVEASAAMGQLRAVLHDHLLSAEPLEIALSSLDRFARATGGARFATVCVLSVDPGTGEAEYCTAGHPPPVVASTLGEARFLEPTGSGPLASGHGFPTRTFSLAEDEIVMLYSDGLVERPGRVPAESTVEILRAVGDCATGAGYLLDAKIRRAQRVCQESLEVLTRATGHADDITVLTAARAAAPPSYRGSWAATEAADRASREDVAAWLEAYDVAASVHVCVTHAVSELVANAVRHAYAHERRIGEVEVFAAVDDQGWLECSVIDHGVWKGPETNRESPIHPARPRRSASRGLAMVRGLVDELELVHDETGTRATFRLGLGREAQLLADTRPAVDRVTPEHTFRATAEDDIVRVGGAVDLLGAAQLSRILRAAQITDGELVVDLSAVTHLGSSGLQVLHEASAVRNGTGLRLVAPYGSVAQHVLELVKLPYADEQGT